MKVTLHTDTRQVSHPTKPGLLTPGETVDAPDLWVRQHTPLVRAGEITVEDVADARCKAKTKSGSRCKRDALDGEDFCSTHLE